jgi:hypothetical protein
MSGGDGNEHSLILQMCYPCDPHMHDGYKTVFKMVLGCAVDNVRPLLFLQLLVYSPDPLVRMYGPTLHALREETVYDLANVRLNVDCLLDLAYWTHIGIRRWEVILGGLRNCVPTHWSQETPVFHDWKEDME